MKTVYALYTGHGLVDPLAAVFAKELPGVRLINVVDDSIIRDVGAAGGITPEVASRVLQYYQIGVRTGADAILNTCSSIGRVADDARGFVVIPVVRIDRAMAGEAVSRASRIGVIATLPTTLDPTLALIEDTARDAGRSVTAVPALARGAYDELVSGHPERHDELILEAARAVIGSGELFVLAQGSMARMAAGLAEATGLPVLSSIVSGIRSLRGPLGLPAE